MKLLSTRLKGLVFGLLCLAGAAKAQSVSNLYSGGVSYSGGSVAGTAMYAHQVSADTAPGMYAFTIVDAVPSSAKLSSVSTSIAGGIGQRVASIDGVDVFVPTSAGVNFTSSAAGFSWSTGAVAVIPLKSKPGWYLLPTLRVLKTTDGYQPILCFQVGWGK